MATVIASMLASRLKVDSDLLELMPESDPAVIALQELDRQEGGIGFLSISVRGPDQATVDTFLAEVHSQVEALPEVRFALWRVEPELARRVGALQLSQEDLADVRDRTRSALALGPAASNPFIASQLLDFGPIEEKVKLAADAMPFRPAPNSGRLIVRPAGSSHDVPFARQLMEKVDGILAAARPAERGIEVTWVGGPYRHAIEDVDGIEHDITWTSLPAILLISLAIWLAYRDWRAVVAIMVPQLVGSAWTMGFAKVAVGSVNMFTSFAIAVLVGLGNDYAIVLFSRYREHRVLGLSTRESTIKAWDDAGPPALTAALTSAAGFLALLTASFRGFQQLGLIIGVGVPLCFLSVVLTLPLLLRYLDPAPKGGILPTEVPLADTSKPVSYRWAWPVMIASVLITFASSWAIPYISFDFDLSTLRRAGMAYSELSPDQQALARQSYSPILVEYPDDASLTQDYGRIQREIAEGKFPEVTRALSIRSVIPADAAERGAILDEIAALAKDPNVRYLPPPLQKSLRDVSEGAPYANLEASLPGPLVSLLGASSGHHRMLLLPAGNMWDLRECARVADAVRAHLPGRQIAGEQLIQGGLYRMTLKDGPRVILVSLLLVTILMAIDLGRFRITVWGMAVQIAGLLWAGGALVPLDIDFNLINLVGIPICVGTGIEFAIFLMHRLEEEGPYGVKRAMLTSGLASVLCMVTTLLGFASLIFASNRGIRSLGLLVVAADFVHALAGFVMLPAGAAIVYMWAQRRATRG